MPSRARFLAVLLVIACGAPTPSAPRRAAVRERLTACSVEGATEKVLCGTYSVWENRAAQSGRKIELRIVVVPAEGKEVATDAVVAFAGGPGDSVTRGAGGWVQEHALRAHRDILLVDQRGTGGSHRLDCKVPKDPNDVQGYFGPSLPADEVRRCRSELEAGADLTQYTTSIAADDLDEVRAWLGYDKLDLSGGSYGTRAALEYLRRHGDRVRTATLVGLVGTKQYLPLWHARDGQHALDLVFAACAKAKDCAAAFPELAAEHASVLAALDRAPAKATVASPVDHHPVTVSIGRGTFAEGVRFGLYSGDSATVVPYVIHRAAQGDFAPFARMVMVTEPSLRAALAYGMHLSVTCAEDVPWIAPADVAAAIANTALGDYRVAMQLAACKEWPRGTVPPAFHEPVQSAVPVLVLSGPYDPVTPPRWAEQAMPYLSHGRHVVIPESHHGDGGLSHHECVTGLVARFVESGRAEDLDTSCIASMMPPPFIVDGDTFDKVATEAESGG